MIRLIAILSALLLTVGIHAQQDEIDSLETQTSLTETRIKGTELARLPYVIDVLRQLPKVTVAGEEVTVVGRGTPAIYVGNRKVTDMSELRQIAASRVRSIDVIRQPGAEYGKDVQSVIVIHPLHADGEGFSLDEMLRLDLTHKLSVNNEVSVGWKQRALTLGAFLAYNEDKQEFEKVSFKKYYKDLQPDHEQRSVLHPDIYRQRMTARVQASYALGAKSTISARYSLMNLRTGRTWIPEIHQTNQEPDKRHDIGVEYAGKLGAWELTVGNNTYFDDINMTMFKAVTNSYYNRSEHDIRTYAKAAMPLWKGALTVGAEHEYKHMTVDKYDEDLQNKTDIFNSYSDVHAKHPDNTTAIFASTSQTLGKWTVSAGLRYEHIYSAYQPCDNDGFMTALNEVRDFITPDMLDDYPVARMLFEEGKIHTKRDFIYPSLTVTTQVGKSQFALTHTQSSVKPNLAHTRLMLDDMEYLEEKILWTERVATTSLDWRYKWANITAIYARYCDPICTTFDGTVTYNAPDYDGVNINATLAPRFGVWSPVLNVNVNKQWFPMQLANGKDKLRHTLLRVSMNNTITLPCNWLIFVDANWHGKGASRNWYYYSPNFSLDASVQKDFPRQKLTLILSAKNILRNSYMDVTRYTQAFNNLSDGAREQVVRLVSLSARIKI